MLDQRNPGTREALHKLLAELGLDSVVLVISNVIIIVLALLNGWQITSLLWVYWWQNNIIGFFNWLRMRKLKNFTTGNLKEDGRFIAPTEKNKKKISWFFLFHFGSFQMLYLAFLIYAVAALPRELFLTTVIGIAIFIFNHAFSFRRNLNKDISGTPNIGTMMFLPYARIMPMQFVLVIGGLFGGESRITMVLFLLMKSIADLLMHLVQHVDWSTPPAPHIAGTDPHRNHKQRLKAGFFVAWVGALLFILFTLFVITEMNR